VFMQEHDVRQGAPVGALDERGQHVTAAVQPDGRRQEETDFFGERGEPGGGTARRGDQRSRVDDSRQVRVFVVEGEDGVGGRVRFVVGVGGVQGGVVGEGRREGFAAFEGCFQLGAFRGGFGVAEGERSSVEVVSSFAGLSALFLGGKKGSRGSRGWLACSWWRTDGGEVGLGG
jgi:hypothetical protein